MFGPLQRTPLAHVRPSCAGLGAAWSSGGVSVRGTGWNEMGFQVPSNPSQFGMLGFYVTAG